MFYHAKLDNTEVLHARTHIESCYYLNDIGYVPVFEGKCNCRLAGLPSGESCFQYLFWD